MHKIATILLAAFVALTSLFNFNQRAQAQNPNGTEESERGRLSPAEAERIIALRAREVMRALKRRDMQRLATFVHPQKGVRFSPYVYVEPKSHRVVRRNQLASLYRSKRRLTWGEADGSGDPIRLTFRKYFDYFVYRQDLLTDKKPAYNAPSQGGNTISNVLATYPRAITVTYGHDGITGPEGGAMDWQRLTLVFERLGNQWYLTGIVNDEWTI